MWLNGLRLRDPMQIDRKRATYPSSGKLQVARLWQTAAIIPEIVFLGTSAFGSFTNEP
jgi:hypothetical protein